MHSKHWMVPTADGWVDEISAAPPVAKVTLIYGINLPTLRTIFLKHRDAHVTGGVTNAIQSQMKLDSSGEIDGLVVYDGQGFETSSVPQVCVCFLWQQLTVLTIDLIVSTLRTQM